MPPISGTMMQRIAYHLEGYPTTEHGVYLVGRDGNAPVLDNDVFPTRELADRHLETTHPGDLNWCVYGPCTLAFDLMGTGWVTEDGRPHLERIEFLEDEYQIHFRTKHEPLRIPIGGMHGVLLSFTAQ